MDILYNSILELIHITSKNFRPLLNYISVGVISFACISSLGYYQLALWCLKWIGLGILSSIGFGFGMHTFVLFLAPHIVAVTLASQSCHSLNFPEPPYPYEIICPDTRSNGQVSFLDILNKVGLESFMWGLGTAIGELPPYLAARLRAQSMGREAIDNKWEIWMIWVIDKIGFIGILLCASIPNPLFDAAGIASGTAQVPFITFFGATFLGKAVFKVLIQTSFVIFLFQNDKLDLVISGLFEKLGNISPMIRNLDLHGKVVTFLEQQRTNFLRKGLDEPKETSMISNVFGWLTWSIMFLFMISVIMTLDKRYRERTSRSSRRDD